MPGNTIVREGEIANEMFFIQMGEVQVVASDGKTPIALLREGAFFGEIGVILTGRRTVSVIATKICVLQVLTKEDFDELCKVYKGEYNYLRKVAKQRMQIIDPEDLLAQKPDEGSYAKRLLMNKPSPNAAKMLQSQPSMRINSTETEKKSSFSFLKKFIIKYISEGEGPNEKMPNKKKVKGNDLVVMPTSK